MASGWSGSRDKNGISIEDRNEMGPTGPFDIGTFWGTRDTGSISMS